MFPARAPFGVPYFHPPCNEAALPFGFALDGYQAKAELQRAERRREWLKRPMLLPPGSAEFNERESLALRLRLAAVSHEPMAKVGAEIALLEFDHGQRKRRHAEEQRALAASAAESEQRERQAAARRRIADIGVRAEQQGRREEAAREARAAQAAREYDARMALVAQHTSVSLADPREAWEWAGGEATYGAYGNTRPGAFAKRLATCGYMFPAHPRATSPQFERLVRSVCDAQGDVRFATKTVEVWGSSFIDALLCVYAAWDGCVCPPQGASPRLLRALQHRPEPSCDELRVPMLHIGAAKSLGQIAAVLEVHVPVLPPLKGDVSLCVAAYTRYEELRRGRFGYGRLLEQQVSAFRREWCAETRLKPRVRNAMEFGCLHSPHILQECLGKIKADVKKDGSSSSAGVAMEVLEGTPVGQAILREATQKVYSVELNHTQALLGAQHRDGAAAPGSVGARIGPAAQAVSQVCSFCASICFLHGVVTKLWGVRLR